jgi:L-lactate dehydrogenase complex protein LldF
MKPQEQFMHDIEKAANSNEQKERIRYSTTQYEQAVKKGKGQYSNLELARSRAGFLKGKVIENLDKYLLEFESNFTRKGGKVIWAPDRQAAMRELIALIRKSGAKTIVKSKSITADEIDLKAEMSGGDVEIHQTDLGEYIIDLANEKPSHMVIPAMHKSGEEVAVLFHEKLGTPDFLGPADLSRTARAILREQFTRADIGITGANFLLADSGSVVITENEGNARLSVTFPKIHIVLAGIEKVLASITDLDLFLPLLSTYGTGQTITAYNTILSGPRQPDETDGPEEMYVILIDNGRTDLLAQTEQRQALGCIKCGACLNVCPIYKNIGGHAYGVPYVGPIGSVITPYLKGMKEYIHLSHASTMCGACTEVCPVNIDLHNLLLLNRKDAVSKHFNTTSERAVFFFWKKTMLSRKKMNTHINVKSLFLKMNFKKDWGKRRTFPELAPRSFNEIWREKFPPEKDK